MSPPIIAKDRVFAALLHHLCRECQEGETKRAYDLRDFLKRRGNAYPEERKITDAFQGQCQRCEEGNKDTLESRFACLYTVGIEMEAENT